MAEKKERKNKEIKKKRGSKEKKSTFLSRFLLFILFFVLLLAVSFGGIFVSAYSTRIFSALSNDYYLLQYGLDGLSDTTSSYVKPDELFFGDTLYLCMDDVAAMCEFTVVGDYDALTYFPADAPTEAATFYYSSELVSINGETFRMGAEMLEKNGKIYVPASFFTSYASGITVTYDEEKTKYTVARISLGTEYDPLDVAYQVYQPIDFLAERSMTVNPVKQGAVFSTALPVTSNNGQ